jgi:hypothetical protein
MPQVFHPSMNTVSRVSIFGAAFFLLGLLGLVYALFRSPYQTWVHVAVDQPVQFSHEHHVNGLGLDCRYCHTSVEKSSFAGVPPTETCMTCHSQIWNDSEFLEPVRKSLRENVPIRWNRVHDLPDYVFFNHAIHVKKGVGCVSCHGRVDQMPLTWKEEPLTMEWCLSCHRHPERHLRPREAVFVMDWRPAEGKDPVALGRDLVRANDVQVERLSDCYTCHR